MKIKNFVIALSVLICCTLAFSACSKDAAFDFDEDGIVTLTYTCTDEQKNFEAKLNEERSREMIFSLNKLSYREVNDKDVDLSASYDFLTIKINSDTLFFSDIFYIIQYGGYFHLNGELCKTQEKFGFLEPYLLEICPEIIPRRIPFDVRSVRQTVGAEENFQIIRNVLSLNDYIQSEMQKMDLPEFTLFSDDVIAKYNDEFFEDSFLVIFMKAASSGSYDFRVNDVRKDGERLIVYYQILMPAGGKDVGVTADMAYWYTFLEFGNEYNAAETVDFVSEK